MTKDLSRYLTKADIHMVVKHVKRCSTSNTIRELQIKTTLRYHYILTRMAKIQNPKTSNVDKNVKQQELIHFPQSTLLRAYLGFRKLTSSWYLYFSFKITEQLSV